MLQYRFRTTNGKRLYRITALEGTRGRPRVELEALAGSHGGSGIIAASHRSLIVRLLALSFALVARGLFGMGQGFFGMLHSFFGML